MKKSQLFRVTTLFVSLVLRALSSSVPTDMKISHMAINIPEPVQTITSFIHYEPPKSTEPSYRVQAKSFMSDKERNMHVINKVLQSINNLLKHDKTRAEKDSMNQAMHFVIPPLKALRGPIAITADVKRLYHLLVIKEGFDHLGNSRIQEYAFERLLVPENIKDLIKEEDIDVYLKQTYHLLYVIRGKGVDTPPEKKSELDRVRKQLLQLRSPIILDYFTRPLRVWHPYWNALNRFLKAAATNNVLNFSNQYSDGKLLMDMLRGLKVILAHFGEKIELYT